MRRPDEGFSLTELMVVVAIMGILSAVGLMSFRRYQVRAHVGEAYTMLGEIKARQEVYRAEFAQYANIPAAYPSADPVAGRTQSWAGGAGAPVEWRALGVRPDREVWFVYQVFAGAPGASPGGSVPGGYPAWDPEPPDDFWFVARARADLDGDGAQSLFELCSACRSVYVDDGALGFDLEGR